MTFEYVEIYAVYNYRHKSIIITCDDSDTAKELSDFLNKNWDSLFGYSLCGFVNNFFNSRTVTIDWNGHKNGFVGMYNKLISYTDSTNRSLTFTKGELENV